MKKSVAFFALVLLLFIPAVFWHILSPLWTAPASPSPISSTTPTHSPAPPMVTWKDRAFAYAIMPIGDARRLTLIPNYQNKTDIQTLMKAHGCTSAANGGFYDEESRPLGYFVSQGNELRAPLTSALFNGYVLIDKGEVSITPNSPQTTPEFALQTGPLLFDAGNPLSLAIKNDEFARRMVFVTLVGGKSMAIALYSPDALYEGPLLADLPDILTALSQKEGFSIARAINLDGGSASAFYHDQTRLSELTPVGSIFCLAS